MCRYKCVCMYIPMGTERKSSTVWGGVACCCSSSQFQVFKGGTMAYRYLLPVHVHVQAERIIDAVPYAYIHTPLAA